jgi:hypothetical protein
MSAAADRVPAAAGPVPNPAPAHAPAVGVSRAPTLAAALLGQLDTEHPALSGHPDRERLAAWLTG